MIYLRESSRGSAWEDMKWNDISGSQADLGLTPWDIISFHISPGRTSACRLERSQAEAPRRTIWLLGSYWIFMRSPCLLCWLVLVVSIKIFVVFLTSQPPVTNTELQITGIISSLVKLLASNYSIINTESPLTSFVFSTISLWTKTEHHNSISVGQIGYGL